jgi:hypothetical protein
VRDLRFCQRWDAMAQRYPGNPRKQLKSAFQLLVKHLSDPAARTPGMAIEKHKAKLREKLAELCVKTGASEPGQLAEQLFLLMDSSHPTLILGVRGPERNVGPDAASLIDARLPGLMTQEGTV